MPGSHFFSKLLSCSLQGLISFCISQDAFTYKCQMSLIHISLQPLSCLSTAPPPTSQTFVMSSAHSFFNLLLSTVYVHHSTTPVILLFLRSPITLISSSAMDTFLRLTRPLTSIHHSFLHCSLLLAVFDLLVPSYCFGFHLPSPLSAFLQPDLKKYFPECQCWICSPFYAVFFPQVISSSPMVSDTANNLTVPKPQIYILNPDVYPEVQSLFCHCILNTSRATYRTVPSLVFSLSTNGSSSLIVAQIRDLGVICDSSFFLSSLPHSSSSKSSEPLLSCSHPSLIYCDLSCHRYLRDLFLNSFVSPNPILQQISLYIYILFFF